MKKIYFLFILIITLSLTSCFDLYEDLTLNEDGSGLYKQKMDLTRVLGLAAGMGSKKEPKGEGVRDSTIYYIDKVDTSSIYTAEEKSALRNMYSKMHMDAASGNFYIEFYYPFKNATEFKLIQAAMSKKDKIKDLESLGSAAGMGSMGNELSKDDGITDPTKDFLYTIENNSLQRNIKPSTKAVIAKEPAAAKTAEEENMMAMFGDLMKMNFTTTINLPKPIKKYEGKNAVLSADKKSITFTQKMDAENNPTNEDFGFKLDY